jgi:hypothetical protein
LRGKVESEIGRIESLCAQETGRGIGAIAKLAAGGLACAARSIAACAEPHVAILTGCFIPGASPPAAETDGPPGAAHLALALREAGIETRLATDSLCRDVVAATAGDSIPIDTVPVHPQDAEKSMREILSLWAAPPAVTHVVSIERIGPARDGRCYNMRGEDVSPWNPSLHALFVGEERRTIGVGDGGNELGMGRMPADAIASSIRHGERIACAVGCDHLIVCGVSNWGAMGLLAALALLRPDGALAPSLDVFRQRRILEAAVDAGAVDGVTRARAMSVDGIPWEDHACVLERIFAIGRGSPA